MRFPLHHHHHRRRRHQTRKRFRLTAQGYHRGIRLVPRQRWAGQRLSSIQPIRTLSNPYDCPTALNKNRFVVCGCTTKTAKTMRRCVITITSVVFTFPLDKSWVPRATRWPVPWSNQDDAVQRNATKKPPTVRTPLYKPKQHRNPTKCWNSNCPEANWPTWTGSFPNPTLFTFGNG